IKVTLDLAKGENKILLKVVNYQGESSFTFKKDLDDVELVPADIATIFATTSKLSGPQEAKAREFYRKSNSPEWKRLFEDVAKWLVDPNHPLTARVTVNRFWQQYFGTGFVKTAEDFGVQGEMPSHPELLDWLATEFIRTGWDVKKMQKLIVTSATYRQSSKFTPELIQRDPENRLLARAPRFRLPAEMVRDQALFVSGLLVEKLGGPSVKPYQPAGLWKELVMQDMDYTQGKGEDLH